MGTETDMKEEAAAYIITFLVLFLILVPMEEYDECHCPHVVVDKFFIVKVCDCKRKW